MRRREDSFNGVMEFLIASAVLHFRATMAEISLSGSPLAPTVAPVPPQQERGHGRDAGTNPGRQPNGPTATSDDGIATGRFLRWLGDALEPVYGFRSLAAFKQRFQPQHRPLYMLYQDPLTLPQIFLALSGAYLPGLSPRQTTRLLRDLTGGTRLSKKSPT
jgi:lysylphosphatidylglycerol synthetase-like protein (DUF2156 family)